MKDFCVCFLMLWATISYGQGSTVSLMPYPQSLEMGRLSLRINSKFQVKVIAADNDQILETATNRFLRRLKAKTLVYFEQENIKVNNNQEQASLSVVIKRKSAMTIGVDESYQLTIDSTQALLKAETTIGALRGLESVLQLVAADAQGFYLPEIKINDSPRFKWRGMMVDVARHFLPIDVLKRNIDAMAMVKLNVLHLHLSDDEGFRVESKTFPKLHELGSNGQYYTQTELKDLIKYASERGIIVYPEFDLPGHSTSWFAGYPELASAVGTYKPDHRFKIKPGTPMSESVNIILKSATPTLDPTKESTYKFLDKFIAEMTTVFSSPYLHIGADENNGMAWKENPKIMDFMTKKGMKDVQELQAYFVKRMHEILKKYERTTVGWEELYNSELPKDVIVQVWGAIGANHPAPLKIAQQGNPTLISKGFYLDYFLPAYLHYQNPHIPVETNANILGGEAALWSELVDENSFEGRAWPRTAAVAERLWSAESVKDIDDMYKRLFQVNSKLEENGLNHKLNTQRMLSNLCFGQPIQDALKVLETLSPARGYGRLLGSFTAPEQTKFQQVPLVNLNDLVSCDSEKAWFFRKQVESYLSNKDSKSLSSITQQLSIWKEAALTIPSLAQKAPNMKEFNTYASKVLQITEIGLKALEKALTENEKAEMLQSLKSMKNRGDKLEIQILPEVIGLVSGTLPALPTGF